MQPNNGNHNQYGVGADATPPHAAVISNTVTVFAPNCPPQDEQDIKDALCLAQIDAIKKYPNDQTTEYFNEIKTILCDTGFANVVDFKWNDVDTSLKDFTIGTYIPTTFALLPFPNIFDLVQKTLGGVKRLQESGKLDWQVISRDSQSNTHAKFAIGVVAPEGKNSRLTMTAYKVQSNQITDNFLWSNEWASQNAHAQSAKAEFILNSELYGEKFRVPVQERLATIGKTFITDVDI